MKFILEIELGNAAMKSPRDVKDGIRQSIEHMKWQHRPFDEGDGGLIVDPDLNTVGKWEVIPSFGDAHLWVGVGYCELCGHYGEDCTGKRQESA